MRADVVDIARRWLGTPYVHQASRLAVGTDCLGLIRGVWRDLHGAEPEAMPAYTSDWAEPEREELLWEAARRCLRPVTRPPLEGDVVLFRMRSAMVAKHVGIVAADGEVPTFIHAYQGHGVVESPFSQPWRRRAVAFFEYP